MYNPDRGSSSDFKNRNSNQQSYSRGGASNSNDDRNGSRPARRNRWDETDNGDSSYRRQRDRSRSPIRKTSDRSEERTEGLGFINADRFNTASKKTGSNWSDSSSDEDKPTSRRGVGGGRSDEHTSYSRWDKRSDGGMRTEDRQPDPPNGQRDLYSEPQRNPVASNVINFNPFEAAKSLNNNQEIGKGFATALPSKVSTGIQMKLLTQLKQAPALTTTSVKPKVNVASVFNVDDDDEPEEMPAECKMRMKNVGRETPTSAGPNSFGKTKLGFCNTIQIKERKIQEQLQKK